MRLQLFDNRRNVIGANAILRQAGFDAETFEECSRFLDRQINLFLVAAARDLPDSFGVLQQLGAFLSASHFHDRRIDDG